MRQGSVTLVEARAVARRLGLLLSEGAGVLTLRSPAGILTLFETSPDVVWKSASAAAAVERSLSGPVVHREGGWWLPSDALSFFGIDMVAGVLRGEDGTAVALAFPPAGPELHHGGELVDLGSGVPGLRLYAPGTAGPATRSLLLADATLLGLALPEHRERFDQLVARVGSDHALILVVTALESGPWQAEVGFSQGDLRVEARHPFRLRLLSGDPASVGPRAPVLGVVLLPESFNLRAPIEVTWGHASAVIRFRR